MENQLESILKMVSRNSAIPLYVQIKEALKIAIVNKVFPAHNRIPSEREFCRLLNVSHITVRQAFNELTKEGFLFRIPGKGTFVPERRESRGQGIGVVIPDTREPISPSFLSALLFGIKRAASNAGFRLFLFTDTDTDYLNLEKDDPLQGVILIDPQLRDARFLILQEKHFPFVVLGNPGQQGIPFVDNDNVKIGYMLTKYLLEQGHRKIAFLNGPLYFTNAEDRKRGFLNALAEFNIPLSDFFIEHGAFREEDGYLITRKFLSERPDALICSDDQQLLGAFRAIQEAGLHVPEEIALACSNHSMFTKIAVPKITLIDIFPENLGTAAAEKLIAIISGKKTENATILDAELIPGN